eukprot:GHVU01128749.1.p3 GENE.GHVU01128749.1~~GHVU01128749.1.p3  ORF type:complete len:100 (+),score=9.46 GHVU01128749.1:1187-1486(+)
MVDIGEMDIEETEADDKAYAFNNNKMDSILKPMNRIIHFFPRLVEDQSSVYRYSKQAGREVKDAGPGKVFVTIPAHQRAKANDVSTTRVANIIVCLVKY